jgi:hypothetical protein
MPAPSDLSSESFNVTPDMTPQAIVQAFEENLWQFGIEVKTFRAGDTIIVTINKCDEEGEE